LTVGLRLLLTLCGGRAVGLALARERLRILRRATLLRALLTLLRTLAKSWVRLSLGGLRRGRRRNARA
jgi:hypothetical protein